MFSIVKNFPFYIVRLWSLYVQYLPPKFTDSWRRARLLPIALHSLALNTPNRVYACIPNSGDLDKDGFRNITYRQLLNAVDTAAWWLDEEVFGTEKRGQIFTYVGPRDLRYGILLLAGIKTGRVLFLMSPHMPPSTQAILFSQIQCQTLLYDPSVKDRAGASKDTIPQLQMFECPSQAHWIDSDTPKAYAYGPNWSEAKDNLVAIFHTSGSTSIPKPVKYTNAAFVCYDSMYRVLAPPFADRRMEGQRFYTMFPPMHTGGITVSLLVPLYRHTVFVSGLATLDSPSPSSVQTILRTARPDAALLTPYVISSLLDLDKFPREADVLMIPSSIGFAGSSLPKPIGDVVCEHVVLRNGYGSTEAGHFSQFPYSRRTWEYLSFHPLLGVEFIPYSIVSDSDTGSLSAPSQEKQLFELVIRPHSDREKRSDFQIIYHTHPELLTTSEHTDGLYHSCDLWTPHPSIHGLWKWVGRTDNMISLSNGGKVFACIVENAIKRAFDEEMQLERQTQIQIEVLLGGHGLPKPFLLVEFLSTTKMTTDDTTSTISTERIEELLRLVLQRIIPRVGATSGLQSKHTEIEEGRMICLDQERKGLRFVRTEKGNVQRGKSFEKYEEVVKRKCGLL